MVSPDAREPPRQRRRVRLAQRLGQVAGLLPRQPRRHQHRLVEPDRRRLRQRGQVSREVPARFLRAGLGVRQGVRGAPDPKRRELRRHARGVFLGQAAAGDGHGDRARRGDVFHDRRARDAGGAVPRELRRRRADGQGRAGARLGGLGGAGAAAEAGGVSHEEGPGGGGIRVAAPGQSRPRDPLRGARRGGAPAPGAVAQQGAGGDAGDGAEPGAGGARAGGAEGVAGPGGRRAGARAARPGERGAKRCASTG